MRLFTGIAIAPEVLSRMEELLDELRPLAAVRWSPLENLHITTKFIGEWPEARLDEIKGALATVAGPGRIPISIRGFGFFPNSRHPKTVYAGVQAGAGLADLARSVNDALETIGCPRELRPFSPHLTLARLTRENLKHENIGGLRTHLTSMATTEFGAFEAKEFHLYLSKPGPGGSVYTQLSSWRLA